VRMVLDMAKKSRAERVASAGSRVAGRGVGAALSSPFGIAGLGLAAIIILIVIFRKDIGKFFEGLKFPEFPAIPNPFENFEFPKFPDITFPDITFPDITFPDFPEINLPDFSGLFEGFQEQQETFLSGLQLEFNKLFGGTPLPQPQKMVEDTGLLSQEEVLACQCGSTITQDAFGNVNQQCKECAAIDTALPSLDPALNIPDTSGLAFGGLLDFLGLTPAQQFAQQKGGFDVPFNDPTGLGGGVSFIGGTTTFGSGIVDTLSEVLAIFPNLTASQAADALAENSGLTKNEFAQISPDIINISSAGGDPEQILLNASGGFSGLTPEQIANILTGGNISNF